MGTHEWTDGCDKAEAYRLCTEAQHAKRDPRLKATRPKPHARWPPEDGQPHAAVNCNLVVNIECCADGRLAACLLCIAAL